MRIEDVSRPSESLLDEVDGILMRAYGSSSRRARVERFLSVDHGGWVVLRDEDRIAAVGGYIGYPSGGFGWIGLVATDPADGRRGYGRVVTQALVDRLAGMGCASVLDGSAKGAPLYEQMGFADRGHSRIFAASSDTGPDRAAPSGLSRSTIEGVGFAAISAYDKMAFGADRSSLLQVLVDDFFGRNVVLLGPQGDVVGYGIAQDDGIGPVVANDIVSGAWIVETLRRLRWAAPPWIIVPPDSPFGVAVESLGFVLQRSLRRQLLGIDELPGHREFICAQISFGEG